MEQHGLPDGSEIFYGTPDRLPAILAAGDFMMTMRRGFGENVSAVDRAKALARLAVSARLALDALPRDALIQAAADGITAIEHAADTEQAVAKRRQVELGGAPCATDR